MNHLHNVVLLGSTGSIGTQAVDVVQKNPDKFRVVGLAAGGNNLPLLAHQALELEVSTVAVADPASESPLRTILTTLASQSRAAKQIPAITAGPDAVVELAGSSCSVVLNAMIGSIGLAPTLAALQAGNKVALANKESLVAGGQLVLDQAKPGQLIPVDSEHSGLAQCLRAGSRSEVRRLILTASGGPFRGWSREAMTGVTAAQALDHPTWSMGPANSINSATLMNKGLEVIETHLLFDVPYEAIDVVIHPGSMVHSMVEFCDGSSIVQASPPDMRLPISLALGWPDRVPNSDLGMDWTRARDWRFEPLDNSVFPSVELARAAGKAGGVAPAVFNAANEESVSAFLAGHLSFLGIVNTVEQVLADLPNPGRISNLDDVQEAETWARQRAQEVMRSTE